MALGAPTPAANPMMGYFAGLNAPVTNPNPSRQAMIQRAQEYANQAANMQTARSGFQQLQGTPPAQQLAQQINPTMGQAAPMQPPMQAMQSPAAPLMPGPANTPIDAAMHPLAGVGGGAGGAGIPPTALGGAGAAGDAAGAAGGGGIPFIQGGAAAASELPFAAAAAAPAARFSAAGLGQMFGGANKLPMMGGQLGGLAPEGLGATLAPAGLGMAAGGLINYALPNQGNWQPARTVLSDVARGTGIGATVGMMGGPFAPISVPVGALLGAGIGGLVGERSALAGTKASQQGDKNQSQLGAAMQNLGLPAQDQAQFGAYYQLLAQQNGGGTKGGQAALQTLTPLLWQHAQDLQTQTQQANAALASQAMAQQFMAPLTKNMVDSASAAAAYEDQVAQNLPAGMRPMWQSAAADRIASANSQAANFAQQMALAPQMQALQNYQSIQKQVANQALQPTIKDAASTASGGASNTGGSNSLASLLKK